MALASLNLDPTHRQLKQFGAICVVAFPLIAWIWTRDSAVAMWACAAGVVLAILAFVVPKAVKPMFVGLTLLTFPIGLVVGELAMMLIYFGLFLPMSIVFRLIRRDSLQRRSDFSSEESFWQKREQNTKIGRYYQQF